MGFCCIIIDNQLIKTARGRLNKRRPCGFATFDIGCANDKFGFAKFKLKEFVYFYVFYDFFYVFDETFLFDETLFGELHLVKLHLANLIWQNFIWRNFIWRRLATPIHSLALPANLRQSIPWLCDWTDRHTNIHMLNYIIDYHAKNGQDPANRFQTVHNFPIFQL